MLKKNFQGRLIKPVFYMLADAWSLCRMPIWRKPKNKRLLCLNLILRKSTLNLLVTANWSCIEAHIIAAVKIRDHVTLLNTESRVSTMKARPCMLVAPAKFLRTCKTTILEISPAGTRLKKNMYRPITNKIYLDMRVLKPIIIPRPSLGYFTTVI